MATNHALENTATNQALENMTTNQALENTATNQALKNMATNQALENMATNQALENTVTNQALENTATNQALENTATNHALENMATNHALENTVTNQALENTATNHPTQELHSYPECEIVFEAGGDKPKTRDRLKQLHDGCVKNPGHPNFIPATELGLEHLPEDLRTEKYMRFIKRKIDLTVKIDVRCTSVNRPETWPDGSPFPLSDSRGLENRVRFGTGSILPFGKSGCESCGKCPCQKCKRSDCPKMKYWLLLVKTATHVICDNSEAERSVFECFYDTENRREVKQLFGLCIQEGDRTKETRFGTDAIYCVCVTHEEDTVDRLINAFGTTLGSLFGSPWAEFPATDKREVMISHPHGCSKRITVGSKLFLTAGVEQYEKGKLLKFCRETICRLPLKPWSPDVIHSQNWIDEKKPFFQLMFQYLYEVEEEEDDFYYRIWSERAKSGKHENVTQKVYNVLIGSVHGVYNYALATDFVYVTLRNAESMCNFVTMLITKRYRNVQLSPTKTVETIDIGLILFRCFFILLIDVLKNVTKLFVEKESSFNLRLVIVEMFTEFLFSFQPEFQPLFDLQQYVTEKSEEFGIDNYEYSDPSNVKKTLVKILTGDDVDINKPGDNNHGNDYCNDNSEDWIEFENEIFDLFFNLFNNCFSAYSIKPKYLEKMLNLSVGEFMQPGTEFKLPLNIYFLLPPDPPFVFRYYRGELGSFVFPTGTKFVMVMPGIKQYVTLPIPCEAEFICDTFLKRNLYMSHDIDTCPGSSGAPLYPRHNMREALFIHSGVFDSTNRSTIAHIHRNYRPFENIGSLKPYQIPSIDMSELSEYIIPDDLSFPDQFYTDSGLQVNR